MTFFCASSLRELGLGGEVQVRVEDEPFAEEAVLRGERLLHLDDHLGAPGLGGGLHDGRSGPRDVGLVGDAAPLAAPVSTTTWPCVRLRTPAGVMPTRYSRVLISLGTPMIMRLSVSGGGFERDPQERCHLRGIAFLYFSEQSQCM